MSIQVYLFIGSQLNEGDRPECYQFDTQAEADAFLYGVSEGAGFLDYEIVDSGDYTVDENSQIVPKKGE